MPFIGFVGRLGTDFDSFFNFFHLTYIHVEKLQMEDFSFKKIWKEEEKTKANLMQLFIGEVLFHTSSYQLFSPFDCYKRKKSKKFDKFEDDTAIINTVKRTQISQNAIDEHHKILLNKFFVLKKMESTCSKAIPPRKLSGDKKSSQKTIQLLEKRQQSCLKKLYTFQCDKTTRKTYDTSVSITFQNTKYSLAKENIRRLKKHFELNWNTNTFVYPINVNELLHEFHSRTFNKSILLEVPIKVRYKFFKAKWGEVYKKIKGQELTMEIFLDLDSLWNRILYDKLVLSVSKIISVSNPSKFECLFNIFFNIDTELFFCKNFVCKKNEYDAMRPSFDVYFMSIANEVRKRSNCMKRSVGCVIVVDGRIAATGYNGTPAGLQNCNEGGCVRCNSGKGQGIGLEECMCVHAEENAFLIVGMQEIKKHSQTALYTTLCPCRWCTKIIVQSGVKRCVYQDHYVTLKDTIKVFEQKGIELNHLPSEPKTITLN